MTRTDIHAPASPDFDPEAYDCWGVFDNHELWGSTRERKQVVATLVAEGYKFGHGSSSTCGHCGTHIRYAALMVHKGAKQFIFVGEDCLANRFEELTKAEFQMLRKAASLNRERQTKAETFAQTLADNPWLEECPTYGGDFLDSLYAQAQRGKQLSERQIEAGQKALAKAKEREAAFQARAAAEAQLLSEGVKAPEGKVTVVGTVVKIKWHENAYGGSLKMIVETDEGWKVWSTVPRNLQQNSALINGEWVDREDVQEGERVEFTATLTRSDRDPLFAFAKRPTKARVLQNA